MSDDGLATFLTSLGLERFLPVLVEHEVDLDTLRILAEPDLEQLGFAFGPRKKLLHALAGDERADAPPVFGDRERRHLTVMFCDMVGFTELASRLDPEVLESIMRTYEDVCAACVSSYDGYLHSRLGDGVIAFFGYPRAHEREAERAIRTALAIHERLAALHVPAAGRLRARVGIASGVVLVSPADDTAAGETMNLASRLQNAAPIGGVVITSRVHQLAGDVFAYRDVGRLSLKGIAEPVHTYEVVGVRDVDSLFAATHGDVAPLIGRDDELASLLDRWRSALGGAGQVACLVGEAGIGKSRTLAELRQRTEADDAVAIVIQGSPYHEHSAYFPVAEALRHLLDIAPDTTADDALDAVERLCERFGRVADVPFLSSVMALPYESRFGPIELLPRDRKERTIEALVGLIAAVAEAGPTVLLVEDLHWADPSTFAVLDALVARIARTPLLVVTTQRPEAAVRWEGHDRVVSIELGRLTDDESRELVTRLASGAFTPATIELVAERADGIPLFAEELTAALLEAQADPRPVPVGHPVVVLPHTLRDLLAARLDRLGGAKETAQLGAVIGRDFSVELLGAIADRPAVIVAAHLDELHRSGLATRHGDGTGSWFTFKHALVRDAAYESITMSRRQELHGRIADALDGSPFTPPELVARHLTAAGRSADAVRWWREAGVQALHRFALAEAVAHYSAGLDLVGALPPGADRDLVELELRSQVAPALVAVRGWAAPDVAELLTPAVPLARQIGNPAAFLPVLQGLWVHHMSAAEHATAVDWAREQLSVAAEHDDETLELCGHRSLMTSNFWMGDLRTSLEHGDHIRARYDRERHHHIAELTNADPLTADGSYRCQALWILGHPDLARDVSDEKDEFARRRNHPFDLCFALTIGALTFDYRREPDALLARVEEAIRVGREHRVPLMSETMAQIIKGIGWLRAGRIGESIDQIAVSLDALRATGHRAWVPYVHATLGEAMALGGDPAGGLAQVELAISLMRAHGELVHYPEALRLAGWIRCEVDDGELGEQLLRESLAVATAQGARSWQLRTATTLAERMIATGRPDAARDVLAPVAASFDEGAGTADHRCAAQLLVRLEPTTNTPTGG